MSPKKIRHVSLKSITVAACSNYLRKLIICIKAEIVVSEKISVAVLESLLETFEAALKSLHGFRQTERLKIADEKRDKLLSAINMLLKAFVAHESEDQDDAKALYLVLNSFGVSKMRHSSYGDETALLRSLVERFNAPENIDKMAKFSILSDWLTELEEANDEFDAIMNEKISEIDQDHESCTVIRNKITPIYNDVIDRINANALLQTAPEFITVVDEVNSLIEAFHLV